MRMEGKQDDRCFQICNLVPFGVEKETKGKSRVRTAVESVERESGQMTKMCWGRTEGGGYRYLS